MTIRRWQNVVQMVILVVFLLPIVLVSAQEPDMLLQSDFETDGERPAEWGLMFGGAVWGDEIVASETKSFDGRWSIQITDEWTDRGIGLRSSLIPIQPLETYVAKAYLYNVDSSYGTIYLEFWDEDEIRIWNRSAGASVRNEWGPAELEGMAPAEARYATVLLYSSGPNVGTTYFDAVTLRAETVETEEGWAMRKRSMDVELTEAKGYPIQVERRGEAALGWDRDGGRQWYFTVPGSDTDWLYAMSLDGSHVTASYPFAGGGGQAWAIEPLPNGNVYFTAGSTLFLLDAEENHVVSLGRPHSEANMIWDLSLDRDGNIFGATSTQSKIFTVNAANRSIIDLGSATQHEYARALAAADSYMFVSVGPEADVVAIDRNTGETKSILPQQYKGAPGSFITYLAVRDDRLFVSVGYAGTMLVFDTNNLELVDDLYGAVKPVSPVGPNGEVYMRLENRFYKYDLSSGKMAIFGAFAPTANVFGIAEVGEPFVPANRIDEFKGLSLVGFESHVWASNLETSRSIAHSVTLPPSPVRINSMGSSGTLLYGGGIAPGGLFVYDTDTDETLHIPPHGQTDSLAILDDALYFGTYPGAYLKRYDLNTGIVTQLGTIGIDQDRPVVTLAHEGRIYVGTVPGYGIQGGALGVYDPAARQLHRHGTIIANHSIVSLTGDGPWVYGGSSTLGGLGKDRVPGGGVVFAWDTLEDRVAWQRTPLPDEPAIGALIVGADGRLWGAGTHTIFALDATTGEVVFQQQLVHDSRPAYTWREAFAGRHGQYVLFQLGGDLVVIDPIQQKLDMLAGPVDRIAVTDNGDLFFTRGSSLYRLAFAGWDPAQSDLAWMTGER